MASPGLTPEGRKTLMPLYSGGLCEADIITPNAPSDAHVASDTAGVGSTPTHSASVPLSVRPRTSALSSSGPDSRVSLPTMHLPPSR